MSIENNYPSKVWHHCPYCGSTSIEWDGTHCMRCTQCSKRFYINAASAVVALIYNEAGELLLTRRQRDPMKGTLDLPGGFVDLGETGEAAVIRETKEELSIDLETVQYYTSMPNRYLFGGIVYFTLDLVFKCKAKSLAGISAADDVCEYLFVPIDQLDASKFGLESISKLIQQLKEQP